MEERLPPTAPNKRTPSNHEAPSPGLDSTLSGASLISPKHYSSYPFSTQHSLPPTSAPLSSSTPPTGVCFNSIRSLVHLLRIKRPTCLFSFDLCLHPASSKYHKVLFIQRGEKDLLNPPISCVQYIYPAPSASILSPCSPSPSDDLFWAGITSGQL